MSSPAPLLRRLRVSRLERDGQELVALHDPLGLAGDGSAGPVVVPMEVWEIIRRFDGHTRPAEIAASLSRSTGRSYTREDIERVAAGLSEKILLEDASFERRASVEHARFRAVGARPPAGAGSDYEADPLELRIRVAGLVANDWDMPPPPALHALFAPAGSLERAGRLYARTYAALRHRGGDYERVLLLASAGAPLSRLLVPLSLRFDTPLGALEHDAAALRALDLDPGHDELAHRHHLPMERHALFLRLLFPKLKVLPILSGTLPARLPDGQTSPRGLEEIEAAVAALERVCALDGRTLLLAVFDLAHLEAGSKEGLPFSTDGAARLREHDRTCVDRARELDAEGFWREGVECPDPARAASLIAPYLVLRLLENRSRREPAGAGRLVGEVTGYLQMSTRSELDSAVAAAFHESIGSEA